MPSKSPLTALRDILHHIELAEHFVTDIDNKTFLADVRTIYAVTRCLEVISEASRRFPASLKARHPSIPWKDIAGAGNIYRHDYEDVVPSENLLLLLSSEAHSHLCKQMTTSCASSSSDRHGTLFR